MANGNQKKKKMQSIYSEWDPLTKIITYCLNNLEINTSHYERDLNILVDSDLKPRQQRVAARNKTNRILEFCNSIMANIMLCNILNFSNDKFSFKSLVFAFNLSCTQVLMISWICNMYSQ